MGSVMGLFPMFVILKSISTVPSGFSSPVGISRSSRIGKSAEWPGVVEPGKGPRPRLGRASCWVASTVNGACGPANSNNSRAESSTIKTTSNFNRFTCFSPRWQRLLKCNAPTGAKSRQVVAAISGKKAFGDTPVRMTARLYATRSLQPLMPWREFAGHVHGV